MKQKDQKDQKNLNGFSFLEVMVSIFILTAGIVAVMPFLGKSMEVTSRSRDHVMASLLAQEGVELVQNIRDNAWVDENFATSSFSQINNGNECSDCRVDKDSISISTSSDFQLKLNGGFYVHTGATATKFYRKIIVAEDVSSGGKKITSMVVWNGGTFVDTSSCNVSNRCAYAERILTKWGE